MKTYKNLFEEYISDDNIIVSIMSARRGNKAKHTKRKLNNMLNNLEVWIPKLRRIASNFHNKPHKPKEIYDGISRKKRTIIVPSAVELVIQHMQVNILRPIFLRGMYEHTYAAIPTRGAHKGKKFLEKWIRNDRKYTKYCLKLDVHHFFESIDRDILKTKLATKIKDEKFLSCLYTVIDVGDKGLPLGYYTSQWYANWYLQDFDRFIKQVVGAKYYIRYMDDMVILGGNKRKLHKFKEAVQEYLMNELKLELKGDYKIFPVDKYTCIDFMGFKFYSNRTTLRKSIMLKATRKANGINKKSRITVHDARQMMAYVGWLSSTNTYSMYRKWIKPKISFRTLRKIISRYDRRVNKRCGTKQKAA